MKPKHGIFVTGTDTDVGKTYIASQIASTLFEGGCNVGVYKPVASGCPSVDGEVIAEDAVQLWNAAGKPKTLHDVCPLRFQLPLAPHLAARAEGHELDFEAMVSAVDAWADCDYLVIEGAGGLMSPVGDHYIANLAEAFGFPLLIVAANKIGCINQTLQTLIVASTFKEGLPVAGIVLNSNSQSTDKSTDSNRVELEQRCVAPVLAEVSFGDTNSIAQCDWKSICDGAR